MLYIHQAMREITNVTSRVKSWNLELWGWITCEITVEKSRNLGSFWFKWPAFVVVLFHEKWNAVHVIASQIVELTTNEGLLLNVSSSLQWKNDCCNIILDYWMKDHDHQTIWNDTKLLVALFCIYSFVSLSARFVRCSAISYCAVKIDQIWSKFGEEREIRDRLGEILGFQPK